MLDSFIRQLEKDLEISFPSSSPGSYVMPISQDLSIEITSLPQGFQCACVIGECPKQKEEIFLEKVLHANLFGLHTKDAVIGLNEDQNLTLLRSVENAGDYREFKDILEDFVNTAVFWHDEAKGFVNTVDK